MRGRAIPARSLQNDRRLALRLRRRRLRRREPATFPATLPAEGDAAALLPKLEAATRAAAQAEELLHRQRDQTARLQAEFENFRRRSKKETEDLKETASAELITSLLPVLDNFGRALAVPPASLESFGEGIRLIHDMLEKLLGEAGLERLGAVGQSFDPHLHEAVSVDGSGQLPDNQIAEVLQEGYLLRGKLLRPALVRVARQS